MAKRLVGLVLGCVVACGAFADDVADSCLACHKDGMSLKSWKADALATRLKEIKAGRVDHMVPLPDLTDEQLAALAKQLAGP